MREKIHPTYFVDATVTCACGNTWKTGSTKKEIRTEVCSNCHPFFTGQQQRILDVEGQVERFNKRLQARQSYLEDKQARADSKVSMDRPIAELELGTRPSDALLKAGLDNVGKIFELLEKGDDAVLAVEGFGRKSLIDLKKSLRGLGYKLPGDEA